MLTLPPQVHTALDRLTAAGWEPYVVGGAVRDALRGSPAGDWDITTNAEPAQVERVFAGERLIETGLKHGTVTVLLDGLPLEITTYRVDGDYTDHRRPDAVRFTRSLCEDLLRRDFTMNALAYNPQTGLVDICGGAEDITRGVVRCVGEPDRRFQEDGLRILRALRFASVLGFQIAPETAAAIHRSRALLQYLAAERVRSELTKLLCGQNAGAVLREFADVLAVPIPEQWAERVIQRPASRPGRLAAHGRSRGAHPAGAGAALGGIAARCRQAAVLLARAGRRRPFLRPRGQERRTGGRYPYAPTL